MVQSVGQLSKRLVMLFMALVVILGSLFPGVVVIPAQAGILPITRTYIQTTIDTTNWEILAGVVSYEAGTNAHQVEAKRMGASNLELLAKSTTPSDSGVYDALDAGVGKAGDNTIKNLVLCFPGTMSFSGWNDNSTAEDTSRAQLIRNSMIYDLNAAFKFVYADENGLYTPKVTSGDDTLDARIDQYAKDLSSFLSHIPGTAGELFGKNGAKIVATEYPKNPVDADIADANYGKDYYVTIQRGDETRTFLYRMLKGYGVDGTGLPKVDGDATKYIHWGTLCLEAFVNYFSDEELQVTADNVYNSTPGAIESAIAGLLGDFAEWVANTLGLWNFDELIFNSGVRGTSGYVGGVFPTNWEQIIWTFFFFSEVAAIIMLLYAIIYNVGRKAMATIDPVARASAIEQIKYLFIVAFLLAILPVVLPLLISVSAELTGIFHDSLGGLTAEERFKKLSSVSGTLGSVLTYMLYLGALIYFNVFYVFRALSLALMIILGPIFVAMMAISENKRQLALAWFKEFSANLFIQPLQALMLSFILLVPDTGRNIDSIVMAYVMIPLTNLLRQLFFGSGGSLADRVGQQGKQSGTNAIKRIGGAALGGAIGTAGGALAGGAAAVLGGIKTARDSKANNGENTGKESNNAGSLNTKGDSGTIDSSGEKKEGQTGEKKKGASAAVGAASPVSPGAAGSKTTLSEAAAENAGAADGDADGKADGGNAGNSDSGEKAGAAGTSGGETGPKPMSGLNRTARIAGGLALAAIGGVGLGAIAGGVNGLTGRRYFGGPGGGGLVNQLSRAAATKGGSLMAEGITGRRANGNASGSNSEVVSNGDRNGGGNESGVERAMDGTPLSSDRYTKSLEERGNYKETDNAYTRGQVNRKPNHDGSSTYTFKDDEQQKAAGISKAGPAGDDSFIMTYNRDLDNGDWGRLEQIQNIMENGTAEEKEALAAAGITGFEPSYSFNPKTNNEEMTGASITYNRDAAAQNFGIGHNQDTGELSFTSQGDTAPHLVPDAPSYLNSQQAAVNYGTKDLASQNLGVKINGDTVDISSSDVGAISGANVPEALAPIMRKATMGDDGQLHTTMSTSDFAQAYAIPASNATEFARGKASVAAPEGTAIAPSVNPIARTTVGEMENFQGQSPASTPMTTPTVSTVDTGYSGVMTPASTPIVPGVQGGGTSPMPVSNPTPAPVTSIPTEAPVSTPADPVTPINTTFQNSGSSPVQTETSNPAAPVQPVTPIDYSQSNNPIPAPTQVTSDVVSPVEQRQTASPPPPVPGEEEHYLPRRPDPESGARDDDEFPIDIGAILMRSMEKSGKKDPPPQKNSPIHHRRGGES